MLKRKPAKLFAGFLSLNGNIKARAFNRSAINPLFNSNTTTQGIGLYYRKEFDSIKDLFKKRLY